MSITMQLIVAGSMAATATWVTATIIVLAGYGIAYCRGVRS